jgi:hypothetical protein
MAKHATGSNLRSSVDAHEKWKTLSEEERNSVRTTLENWAVTQTESGCHKGVGLQMAMVVANVARFDYPFRWPQILNNLIGIVRFDSPAALPTKRLALLIIKNIVAVCDRPLVCKRQDIRTALRELHQVQASAIEQCFQPLLDGWNQYLAVFIGATPISETERVAMGQLACQILKILSRLLALIPESPSSPNPTNQSVAEGFFGTIQGQLQGVCQLAVQPTTLSLSEKTSHPAISARLFVVMAKIGIYAVK